jgi:hypothetical protein
MQYSTLSRRSNAAGRYHSGNLANPFPNPPERLDACHSGKSAKGFANLTERQMTDVSQREDGIPLGEVARMFNTHVDTMRKRIEKAGFKTWKYGRIVYVEKPEQWPVQWGDPIPATAGSNLPAILESDGMAALFAQVSERDQRIGKLEEQLRAAKRENRRLQATVETLNAAIVDLRGIWREDDTDA